MVAVARHRSFTRAADSLRVAQPALSAQVRNLERELGVRLFERTTRRVTVTAAGAAFTERAERILAEAEVALMDMVQRSGAISGTLRIGAWFTVNPPLPRVLAGFVEEHPNVNVEVREENSDVMVDLLRKGELDVALLTIYKGLEFRDIEHAVYLEEPFILEVSPRSKLPDAVVTLRQIADEPLVIQKPGSAFRRLIERAFKAVGRTPRVAVETSQTAAIRDLVAAGVGSAIVPRSLAEVSGPPIRLIRFEEPPMRVSALAWRRGGQTPATSAFVAYARGRLSP